jgi:hypothetical protein
MINRARREGLPMLAALGLYTPASDVSGDSGVVNSDRDLMPADLALAFARLNYVPPLGEGEATSNICHLLAKAGAPTDPGLGSQLRLTQRTGSYAYRNKLAAP